MGRRHVVHPHSRKLMIKLGGSGKVHDPEAGLLSAVAPRPVLFAAMIKQQRIPPGRPFPLRISDHRVVVGNERELVKGMAVPRKDRARLGEQATHRDNGWIEMEHFPEDTTLKRRASSSK